MPRKKKISVIVPCRDEAAHAGSFLDSLQRQRLPGGVEWEVLIADGGSLDGTRQALDERARSWSALQIIDNPEGIVSTALNRAIRRSRGEVLIRMDVHAIYADDYLSECLRVLEETGAENAGGPWVPLGREGLSQVIATAFCSPFVSGGARSHRPAYEGPADSVSLGCWRRSVFERFGLFDETLVRSQDNEHNLRIVRGGGLVWQSPRIRFWHVPRGSLSSLFRQYEQYGYWKTGVLKKHHLPATVRQLAPPLFLLAAVSLALAAPFSAAAAAALAVLGSLYGFASLAAAAECCWRMGNWRRLPQFPAVFAAFHFGFGLGYLRGLLDHFVLRAAPAARYRVLTRPRTG